MFNCYHMNYFILHGKHHKIFWYTSQDAKVDLKLLIVSVIPIYSFSETIILFYFLFFILINKLITFSASYFQNIVLNKLFDSDWWRKTFE